MLPPRLLEGHPHEIQAGVSAKVLVLVDGFCEQSIGRYIHELGEWQVIGWAGCPTVVEWWALPDIGSGEKP